MFKVVHRFRNHLGLYVHLHCLVSDGVFEEHGAEVRFLPAPPPTSERMTAVPMRVHRTTGAAENDKQHLEPALAACVQPGLALPHLAAPRPVKCLVPPSGFRYVRYRHRLRPHIIPSAAPMLGQQFALGLADCAHDKPGDDTCTRQGRLGWAELLAGVFAIVVTDDDITRVLHIARAPPGPHPPG